MKFKALILLLLSSNIIFANTSQNLSDALIAEFYLQNNEPEEAYLAYQEIIETQPNEEIASRVLTIVNLTDNKVWQQKSLANLLKFRPNDINLATKYLLSLINPQQFADATLYLIKYSKLLQKTATNQYSLYNTLAIKLANASNKTLATTLIKNYLTANEVGPLNSLAFFHYLLNQQKIAQKYIQKSLTLKPNFPASIVIFANILYAKGETKNAIHFLTDKAKLLNSTIIYKSLAQMLVRNKQYAQSENIYLKLINLDSKNANQWRKSLSTIYLLLDKLDLAKQILLKLITVPKYQIQAYYSLGILLEEQKKPQLAKKYYQNIRSGEYYIKAQKRLANLLAVTDKNGALAIVDNLRVNNLNDYLDLIKLKIIIYELHQDWQLSYDLHTSAIALQPRIELYYSRAILAEKMGEIKLMEKDFLYILEQEKDNYETLNALGYSLTEHTNRYQEAKKYIQRALNIKPQEFYILDSMGWVLHKLGDHQQAIKYLTQAIELKLDAEVAAHLALVYAAIGNKPQSDKFLLQAVLLNKDNLTVIKAIKTLKPDGKLEK